jgi:hypothetical protein
MKLTPKHALAGVGLLAAGGVAYLATRGAGPVQLKQFTELRQGPLQEHLITAEELGQVPERLPHRYPCKIAPGLSMTITQGFSPLYQLPDPQAAALPAEAG